MALPRDHRLSQLIIQDYHGQCQLGAEWLLSRIMARFLIMKDHSLFKKGETTVCDMLLQKMADLPPTCCQPIVRPFSVVGIPQLQEVILAALWRIDVALVPEVEAGQLKVKGQCHAGSITWTRFPHDWPFVREISQSPVGFPHKDTEGQLCKLILLLTWTRWWSNGVISHYRHVTSL